ncbi:hypothetical protein HPP92_001344 [Vanilla planifolia]|uniref:Uncharacterized protein n=1 Tax=Vanilla planifolia TaxID=51239 RepID=A0A835SCR7_VANPL|nr:hypothetical protein HPP92_001344 [Vanilla planifolia]
MGSHLLHPGVGRQQRHYRTSRLLRQAASPLAHARVCQAQQSEQGTEGAPDRPSACVDKVIQFIGGPQPPGPSSDTVNVPSSALL